MLPARSGGLLVVLMGVESGTGGTDRCGQLGTGWAKRAWTPGLTGPWAQATCDRHSGRGRGLQAGQAAEWWLRRHTVAVDRHGVVGTDTRLCRSKGCVARNLRGPQGNSAGLLPCSECPRDMWQGSSEHPPAPGALTVILPTSRSQGSWSKLTMGSRGGGGGPEVGVGPEVGGGGPKVGHGVPRWRDGFPGGWGWSDRVVS